MSLLQQLLESLVAKCRWLAWAGTQIVVLLVPTTQPEDITSYANRVANSWNIGRKDIGDGLLVIVAKNDRKVRIEVAKTLEGAIPDLAAKGIIDQAITPKFKQGDFAGGLDAAVDQIMASIGGEALPAPPPQPQPDKAGLHGWISPSLHLLQFPWWLRWHAAFWDPSWAHWSPAAA